jgi:hypothetical protein
MRLLWVVQHVPADGVVTGDWTVAAKMAAALDALGVETTIVAARDVAAVVESARPDAVVVVGYLDPPAWQYVTTLAPRVPTLFWWLTMHFDPAFGERAVRPARFTTIATNSPAALARVRAWGRHRAALLHLAAAAADVGPAPDAPRPHPVVYLGIGVHKDRAQEAALLGPALGHGLRIHGARWEETAWAPWWHGPLASGGEAALYGDARAALVLTERTQAAMGMINNRPFEVLAAGAVGIAWRFPELQALFGERLLYTRSFAETDAHLDALRAGTCGVPDARAWIAAHHTYARRAHELLALLAAG